MLNNLNKFYSTWSEVLAKPCWWQQFISFYSDPVGPEPRAPIPALVPIRKGGRENAKVFQISWKLLSFSEKTQRCSKIRKCLTMNDQYLNIFPETGKFWQQMPGRSKRCCFQLWYSSSKFGNWVSGIYFDFKQEPSLPLEWTSWASQQEEE